MLFIHRQPWGGIFIDHYYRQKNICGVWLGKWVDSIDGYGQSELSSMDLSSHVSSICFMEIESVGIHITPSSLWYNACHPCSIPNSLQQKSLEILGIISMCLNILWEGPCALDLFFYSLDICLCLHVHLYIEYNHWDTHDMICTQYPTFSTFALPLHSYWAYIITPKYLMFE